MVEYNATEAAAWAAGGAAGGSEEAVAYLAAALAERGYRVHIYVDRFDLPALERGYTWFYTSQDDAASASGSVGGSGDSDDGGGYVRWLLRRDFDRSFPFAVFIAWRTTMNLDLCPASSSATRCILWAHDLLSMSDLPPAEVAGWVVHSIWTQSTFHQQKLAAEYQYVLAQRPLPIPLANGTAHLPLVHFPSHHRSMKPLPPRVGQRAQRFLRLDIVPNGLPDAAFPHNEPERLPPRIATRFVFASAPNRGLQDVLEVVWPAIHADYPMATLEVFYGLSSRHEAMLRWMLAGHPPPVPAWFVANQEEKEEKENGGSGGGRGGGSETAVDQWIAYIRHLVQTTPGVVYHGSVAQSILTSTLQTASFLLYPTAFPETGCITVLRAMAAGCIPITSRYTQSVLATMPPNEFDDGTLIQPLTPAIASNATARRQWLLTQYLPAVRAAVQRELTDHRSDSDGGNDSNRRRREAMRAYAETHLTWRRSAAIVEDILRDLSNDPTDGGP